ncbi:MAG TPA: DUF2007 domain-containing protein [Woeseiaceae bacterium]|nr:DUF2007 domain-containing protein [Woeseiaceae bacterium]
MKKVTSADSLVMINHYRNLLESEGIRAFVRNEFLGSILGEMPFQETWPELWVRNDLDYDRALELLDRNTLIRESPSASWRCANCHEENEGQFAACWSCGRLQP